MTGPGVDIAVLVPVKSFAHAKVRLASALPATARATLAREWADCVLRAARPLPVHVVCDDDEVAAWARSRGAAVISEPGRGLNGAVAAGVAHLAGAGVARVIVAHADLPMAHELAPLADFDGVTVVPDRHEDDTNVIALPTSAGFAFSYGPGSFGRHLEHARHLGLPLRVVRDPLLAWDVDLPADLDYAHT